MQPLWKNQNVEEVATNFMAQNPEYKWTGSYFNEYNHTVLEVRKVSLNCYQINLTIPFTIET